MIIIEFPSISTPHGTGAAIFGEDMTHSTYLLMNRNIFYLIIKFKYTIILFITYQYE